jgi:hypothetical protein
MGDGTGGAERVGDIGLVVPAGDVQAVTCGGFDGQKPSLSLGTAKRKRDGYT